MATTSLDLLLTATAIGIAAWSQIIDNPTDQVDSFEDNWLRLSTASLLFLSVFCILSLVIPLIIILWSNPDTLGVGGTAFFLVLLGVALASIPTAIEVWQALVMELGGFDTRWGSTLAVALFLIISAIVGLLLQTRIG